MNARAGEMVVKCLPCKCEDQRSAHQSPLKCWVSVMSHLQFQSQEVETKDSQSKLASKTSSIYKLCLPEKPCLSEYSARVIQMSPGINHLRIQNPKH